MPIRKPTTRVVEGAPRATAAAGATSLPFERPARWRARHPCALDRRICASLLVTLEVHPRVAMAILRHSKIAVTMDIYSQVSAASTRESLRRLGEAFGWSATRTGVPTPRQPRRPHRRTARR